MSLCDTRVQMESIVRDTLNDMCSQIYEMDTLKQYFKTTINNSIKKIDNDFMYLHSPSLLPAAYKASLEEVSRRRDYEKKLEEILTKLNENLRKENQKRKTFLTKFGGILPHNFIPGLKIMLPEMETSLSFKK